MVLTFDFDETMDQTVNPALNTISFNPDIVNSGTLTLNATATETKWVDGDTFQATYDVADIGSALTPNNGETQPDVNITITGADDFVGNLQVSNTTSNVIDVDTENPEVSGLGITASHELITDADDNTKMVLTFDFDETMYMVLIRRM